MYFGDDNCFILEVENGNGSTFIIPVDISEEDDWEDINPYRNVKDGSLHCSIGKGERDNERKEILAIWKYYKSMPFNGKFNTFYPVDMHRFVSDIIDMSVKFGKTEKEVKKIKKECKI